MIDNTWYMNIESKVLTRVRYEVTKSLKSKYPNINVSNKLEAGELAKFPTVLLKQLPFAEVGQDLEGKTINAVISGFQITVTTDTTQSDASKVMGCVLNIFKDMAYDINLMPEIEVDGDKKKSIMRVQRVVGSGDIL